MPSQLDLDQGGTYRQYVRRFLGPSIGWVWTPEDNFLAVNSGGTTIVLPGTTQVRVGINAPVTIQLPTATASYLSLGGAIPGTSLALPITVIDVIGAAAANNITILPFGSETIDGLSSIKITAGYGSFTLTPRFMVGGWTT